MGLKKVFGDNLVGWVAQVGSLQTTSISSNIKLFLLTFYTVQKKHYFFQSAIVCLIFFQFLYLFLAYFCIDFFHIFFLYSFLHQIIFYIHFETTFATFAYYFYNIRLFFLYPFLDANNFLLVLAVFFLFNNKCCYYSSSLYRKE